MKSLKISRYYFKDITCNTHLFFPTSRGHREHFCLCYVYQKSKSQRVQKQSHSSKGKTCIKTQFSGLRLHMLGSNSTNG